MKAHTEPMIYIYLLLTFSTLILSYITLGSLATLGFYFFVGFLIWCLLDYEPDFTKTMLFWSLALLLDKPEIIE